jgi:hypothetical protein
MTMSRAVVWTDHQSARVLPLGEEHVHTPGLTIHAHAYATRQHASGVRTEHEYFGAICDELERFAQAVVTGSHTALADFRHYAGKHRPVVAARIVAYDVVDHPTDNQLVALARKQFVEHDRMAGTPIPT